ncbi:sodium:proton antiporter [Ancylomarina salipaludis]|uniref:Sodium:proton antiporter n=1 Tax=Ancylomarina salipaludis TaxID=2501299 RepID=A0A4Q1JQ20_9BACT|nr:sodium:proton antiporter NhaD [Ancylomarina salipaludis]RXQ97502.1 sodium:proton antiporter [Ancylomarina salipaludis]
MFTLMVIVFVLGYIAIALEHPLKIDKAASALLIGVITWVIYVIGGVDILTSGVSRAWNEYVTTNPSMDNTHGMLNFITHHEVLHHLSEISAILFFLLGAMTIVEIVDQHQGFKVITDKIKTTNKVKLLWVLSILTFFMSATLDNLTTTIVLVALIRKLIDDQKDRWFFASMVVLAANAGGAWSPIGDVTTIMLWIGGQVTTINIITRVFLPSLATMIVPLIIVSFYMKGEVTRPQISNNGDDNYISQKERIFILCLGVSALLFVPVFKTVTHLPPYLGMLFGLGVMWVVTEIMHKNKEGEFKNRLNVTGVLKKVDVPTVLFFLGILSAVSSMQSAGHLDILASWLDKNIHNIYIINLIIGALSSVVDNVPLVAAAMGMYPIEGAQAIGYASNFVQDGLFWEFLAYCAGTGGSMLIIGSAAGVAAMGMEKIDFIWYLKKISLLALVGYLAGAGVYIIQTMILH